MGKLTKGGNNKWRLCRHYDGGDDIKFQFPEWIVKAVKQRIDDLQSIFSDLDDDGVAALLVKLEKWKQCEMCLCQPAWHAVIKLNANNSLIPGWIVKAIKRKRTIYL